MGDGIGGEGSLAACQSTLSGRRGKSSTLSGRSLRMAEGGERDEGKCCCLGITGFNDIGNKTNQTNKTKTKLKLKLGITGCTRLVGGLMLLLVLGELSFVTLSFDFQGKFYL